MDSVLWLDTGEVRIQGSFILEDAKKLRPFVCSLFDAAEDLKEATSKAAFEPPIPEDGTCCKVSLPKYKGANIGGGIGNIEVWCAASLTLSVAAARTAAGVSWFAVDTEGYCENGS